MTQPDSALVRWYYITDIRVLERYCRPTGQLLTSFSVPATSLKGFFYPPLSFFPSNDTSFSALLKWYGRNKSACAKKNASHKCQAEALLSHFSSFQNREREQRHTFHLCCVSEQTRIGQQVRYKFTPDSKQLAAREKSSCIHTPT